MGTKEVASEVGLGAGASAAATFWTADTAINTTTTAKNSLILNASIVDVWKILLQGEGIECVEETEGGEMLLSKSRQAMVGWHKMGFI